MALSFADRMAISRRYATALYAHAESKKSLDKVEEDMGKLQIAWEGSRVLRRLASNPVVGRDELQAALEKAFKSLKLSAPVKQFIGVLVAHRRLSQLPMIIDAFIGMARDQRGEKTAKVISATALNRKQLESIEKSLSAATKVKVVAEPEVDESLIGGLRVKVGSLMLDNSLDTKLETLRLSLHEAARKAI